MRGNLPNDGDGKNSVKELPGFAIEFFMGPVIGPDSFGDSLALRALWRVSGIAPKLRAGFGGTAGWIRIGLAFELFIDVNPLFGLSLYLGGGP